jgi:TPR repeat protein
MEGELRYAEMLEGTGFQQFLLDYYESENILRKLAEDDFLPAQYELAKRLREGRTISSDFDLADNLLKKAISRNYLQAIEYAWNEKAAGKPINIEFDWLSARFNGLIDYGNTAAMFIWGLINRQARGIAENPEEAWKWLNIAQFSGIRLAAPNPLEYLETRITAEKCHRLFKDILRWLEIHHARLAKWSQLTSLLRSKLTENRPEKWYELGMLFKSGAEGFLRAPVLACGCFKLAASSGNPQAAKEIENLKKLVPEWLLEKSQHAALLMEKTGRLPASED